jgi:hypothetical protein
MDWKFKILFLCLIPAAGLFAADDHDHDHPVGPSLPPRQGAKSNGQGSQDSCSASPSALADFANGENYDFNSVVSMIASPLCAVVHRQVSKAAISQGVKFISSGPYKLDGYAKTIVNGPGSSVTLLDQTLGRTIPQILAENPLSSAELLPLLGQLSLLSPSAARASLTQLIQQEAQEADRKLAGAKAALAPAISADLAVSLLRMGILEPVIAADLGEAVEDLALTVQADSLAKFFRGLAAAATADPNLAAAFNSSASALNRGVQKGSSAFTDDQQARLLRAVFEAVAASTSGALEPGSAELNESVATLIDGKPLTLTALKKLWLQAMRVLSKSPTQQALADAVAASLTEQMVFLRSDVREPLLTAATLYPQLSLAIQKCLALAWGRGWKKLQDGQISVDAFNRLRVTYFEPFIPRILDASTESLDPFFIRAIVKWGLLKDSEVEKKLPRLFLAQLERRNKSVQAAIQDPTAERLIQSHVENFSVNWSLHHAYLPVLNRWVKKNE